MIFELGRIRAAERSASVLRDQAHLGSWEFGTAWEHGKRDNSEQGTGRQEGNRNMSMRTVGIIGLGRLVVKGF